VTAFTFRILGRLELTTEGRRIEVRRPRPPALLAVLLLHPGQVVLTTQLVDGIWGPSPPPSAEHLVRVYISQLRRQLGHGRIATSPPGYMLVRSDEDTVDAEQFERLLARAREDRDSQRTDDALAGYGEALRLVRGPVLSDTPLEGAAAADAARLDRLRLTAEEERIETALLLGKHRELIPELERLVATEPLRERFRAQLMLALYRADRQADALASYRETHRYLHEELGISPSPDLQLLERQILRQDRALAPPPPALPVASPRQRRRTLIAAAAVLLAASAAGIAITRLDYKTPYEVKQTWEDLQNIAA
jgi:DNA-binding SARP family transcriptional activator